MTIDPKTLAALQHQGRRMHAALEAKDRKQVEIIHRRVDQILDNRPGVAGVMPDGEVVYDNDSWLAAQVTEAVNATGEDEQVLTPRQWFGLGDIDGNHPEDPGEPNGGGVGLLDRP